KSTTWLATTFFITSLALDLFAQLQASRTIQGDPRIQKPDRFETIVPPVQQDLPLVPGGATQGSDIPQAPAAQGNADTDNAAQSATEQQANPEALATGPEGATDDLQNDSGN